VPIADCPAATTRAAAFSVNDNGATGLIVALVRPASAAAVPAPAGAGHAASSPTQHNAVVTVLSQPQPAGGPIPYAAMLPTIAQHLATHY
jgi:hypothetical protein